MAGGGVTLAVLGSGVDRAYPRSHASLMTRILQRGLVLSEHEPGVSPRPHHFPRRNRILAALADRVVVVEAAKRSGALITAAVAADLGRDVWAVPGSIFSSNTGGTHRLLEDGAIPVSSLEAWRVSLAEGVEGLDSPGDNPPPSQLALRPHLDGLPRQVWEALEGEPLSLEGLADALGTPGREILPVLASLELEGWLERRPGPTYLRAVA
jgi:DNA processing protein